MTKDDFEKLKNKSIFEKDYRGRKLLQNDDILKNTDKSIVNLIDKIETELQSDKMTISIHCLWEKSGHVQNSKHYKGIACDFHIISKVGYLKEVEVLEAIIKKLKVENEIGLGLYPEWNNRGFHLDTRGVKGRWGFLGGEQVSYEDAREKA